MEVPGHERGTVAALGAQFADLLSRLERYGPGERMMARELEREVAALASEVMRLSESEVRRVLVGVARDLTADLWALRDQETLPVDLAELRERLGQLSAGTGEAAG